MIPVRLAGVHLFGRRYSTFPAKEGGLTNRYKVFVNGENFHFPIEGRYRKVGFYTNVFVSCSSSAEAGEIAVQLIRDDRALFDSLRNGLDDPPRLNATDIEEIDADSSETFERTGYAFYDE